MADWWFSRWESGKVVLGQQFCQCCDYRPAEGDQLTLFFEDGTEAFAFLCQHCKDFVTETLEVVGVNPIDAGDEGPDE